MRFFNEKNNKIQPITGGELYFIWKEFIKQCSSLNFKISYFENIQQILKYLKTPVENRMEIDFFFEKKTVPIKKGDFVKCVGWILHLPEHSATVLRPVFYSITGIAGN